MANNVFIGNADPLLGQPTYAADNEMEAYERQLQNTLQQIKMQKQNLNTRQNQSQSPVWDEIDKFVEELSDVEVEALNSSPEYQEAQNKVAAIINRENMKMLRPVVEGTPDGKEALDNLLSMAKKIKKSASEEANRNAALMNEYMTQYSHLTWQQFIEAKQGKQPKQPKK
ncbi:hypothetical protein NBH15_25590 [Parabacteroides sp. W1-Q-101]|uniref:hypothetical protein n=1 Tax=Parabacteroides caeci TaxID=2949650 RepID=UPI002030BF34|nr:hypothetical protein [Parabacteroides sp. W1-Q-101]MCM0721630.1 hypothetical protein [Parabacteroides sp. W1-Q-101]